MNKAKFILLISLILFISFCARKEYFPPGKVQTGLASWYGPGFHGKKTSSGEIFNMYQLTAAHKTLSIGSYVMVTNLKNGKSVRVRINDRGPFVRGRIIDLSYAAAKMIDLIGPGIVPVKVEVLNKGLLDKKEISKSMERIYAIQVGAFINEKNAIELKKKLSKKYKDVYINVLRTPSAKYYRVRIRTKSHGSAFSLANKLVEDGYSVYFIKN